MKSLSLILSALAVQVAVAQTPDKGKEQHPKLETYRCTKAAGCKKQTNYIVADAGIHGIHQKNGAGCGDWGQKPNATACPDEASCAKNCILSGMDSNAYKNAGITTSGNKLRLQQLINNQLVSPRVYLLEGNKKKYEMLHLTGTEFSFDVEMEKLPCGMNGALYLSEMPQDGGKSTSKNSKAGAYYGAGYCDAQCYVTPFINGVGNIKGQGVCCNELDIWEANSRATHIAPHPCNKPGVYGCTGDECSSSGICDKAGCGWNHNRINVTDFYGRGKKYKVDSTRKFTVTSQFVANKQGDLIELHRHYIQDNKVIESAVVNISGPPKINFINDKYCAATGANEYMRLGGTKQMGDAMSRGMVLAMSVWWSEGDFMAWLDQGVAGPCDATEGDPKNIVKVQPNPEVTFSNIRIGEIGSTSSVKAPAYPGPHRFLFRILIFVPDINRPEWLALVELFSIIHIVANNAFEKGYLARDERGKDRVSSDETILLQRDYWFFVEGDDRYAIVPSFRDWQFPHDRLPEWWSVPSSRTSLYAKRCAITNTSYAFTWAHLIPREEQSWFSKNGMGLYGGGSHTIDDPHNILPLKADLYVCFDQSVFALIPKQSGQANGVEASSQYVLHVLDGREAEFTALYQNRPVETLVEGSREYLFARFAWSIFSFLKPFLTSGVGRRVVRFRLRASDDDTEEEHLISEMQNVFLDSRKLESLYGGGNRRKMVSLEDSYVDVEDEWDDEHPGRTEMEG
ncbi:endoglucanase type C [Fusarium tjaetaba]|uniref:Glucanase n=1 Tax=Fusarium tjaetaba TaxID=1567544 RepID=A0A8H5RBI2_9HYPO|nr:endoglucanase type C [Fusarium tjaetaba]KAF5629993.1 endoglucanase type C [Fusarium tjaetaba]